MDTGQARLLNCRRDAIQCTVAGEAPSRNSVVTACRQNSICETRSEVVEE